jgi:hypothetical protein
MNLITTVKKTIDVFISALNAKVSVTKILTMKGCIKAIIIVTKRIMSL